jgi:hypothetical protein
VKGKFQDYRNGPPLGYVQLLLAGAPGTCVKDLKMALKV